MYVVLMCCWSLLVNKYWRRRKSKKQLLGDLGLGGRKEKGRGKEKKEKEGKEEEQADCRMQCLPQMQQAAAAPSE